MKRIFTILLVLLTLSGSFVFAAEKDPFDSLVDKLLKDFDDYGATVAVKVFTGDISNNERKQISKSVQFSLYCCDDIEITSKAIDADYICSGKIEVDGPNYIITATLVDAYTDKVIGKGKQKVAKNYYATNQNVKVETVVVEKEHDIDAEDVLGAVIVGSVIGGVFHALTPHHHHTVTVPTPVPVPVPAPKPAKPAKPNRP